MDVPFKIDLSGQVAVVTGGTGVIGGMYACALAACGAKVAVLGRSRENGEKVVAEIAADGGEAMAVSANVLDRESLISARAEILAHYGHLNILVNCAGGAVKAAQVPQDYFCEAGEGEDTFFSIDLENVHRELDLNIYGTMLPTQVFGEVLKGQENANIVNISSMSAYHPLTRIPGYSAGKAGVASFTEWCAIYFAKSGIRVNAVAPGFFHTTQNHALQYNEDGTPKPRTQHIVDSTPMGSFGRIEDLVGGLLYLVDPRGSRFVTGTILPIDGGFHIYQGV